MINTDIYMKHSLEYFITASYGLPDFPEYFAAGMVDGVQIGYYDSNMKTAKPSDWTREFLRNNQDHLKWYSEICLGDQNRIRAHISGIMQSLNQSRGVHVLQMNAGCEWDEETDKTVSFMKFSYDGQVFMNLDLQAWTWTVLKPEAFMTKLIWDTQKSRLEFIKGLYNYDCPSRLKQYLPHGRKYLQRTALPTVSLIQKYLAPSVSCFTTGFYPDRAVMFWRKDGEEIHEDVDYREILPNHDHTFQMSVDLNISSVKLEDWERYECVFQLDGVKEDIITRLDKSLIPDGKTSLPSWFPVGLGVFAGLLLLSVCIAGFVIRRKNKNDFQAVKGEQDKPETEPSSTT
ncbi:major histocompatibility complex class I-related gene protein-like [Cheilinus undulatus]|uniref:major histocompatibility complex class I-related gene protein-like n=1 Tax=Cheilinus undulatus TaxID=241271 RepID=UPI001BD5ED9B|nr:major histocompatibility complex class I-related gene protein-like [Cheilinus undulatus]